MSRERDIEIMKEGIFSQNTTRFGKIAEIMVKKMYNYNWSGNRQYDLYDVRTNTRIEVKFSRVLKKNNEIIEDDNALSICLADAFLENRSLNSFDIDRFSFDSNIQQIKCTQFDYLFYGLFFMDCIEIYGIKKENVKDIPGYSNYQHYGNEGEGQFHLTSYNIGYHRANYLLDKINYDELYDVLC